MYAWTRTGKGLGNVLLWFVYEFLPRPLSWSGMMALVALCRISGCATIVLVLYTCLQGPAPPTPSAMFGLILFACLLALAVGNIIKESAFAFVGHHFNLLGRNFCRKGVTIGGAFYREVWRPDGTWRRVELRHSEFSCEWTNREGECHKRVLRFGHGSSGTRARGLPQT